MSAGFTTRRAHRRIPADLGASYEDVGRQVFLRTADLSEGGVFLISRDPPPLGSPAKILIEVPGDPAIHRLEGVVVRHQAAPRAGFAVAFASAGIDEVARTALRRFAAASGVPLSP